MKLCCEAVVNFLPVVKRFMAYSIPEVKPEVDLTDHGGYCYVIEDCE